MEKRILDKLDKIDDTLVEQARTLERLTTTVEDHVQRSNKFEDALKPLQEHVSMVKGALKLLGVIGLIAAIIEAIHRVMP